MAASSNRPHNVSIRPAHTSGTTLLAYTRNGRRLVTVGANNTIRVFETGSDGEPTNIDDCQDSNTAVVASDAFFVTGCEDGIVSKYSLATNNFEETLVRCTLPIRDLALSPDSQWLAVASDEIEVKVVNTENMTRIMYLREQSKPAKHVAFDHTGSTLAVSSADGNVYMYSLSSEEPRLVKKLDGLIRPLETEDRASSEVAWHPDGRAFAAPNSTRDVQVISTSDWNKQRSFKAGHAGDITALAWSSNGALLVTAGSDKTVCLWDTKTQKVIKREEGLRGVVCKFSWHPVNNIISYTNDEGELYIHSDFVPAEYFGLLEKTLQPAPFVHDPLGEISGNAGPNVHRSEKESPSRRNDRRGTPDSLDDILGPSDMSDTDGFVEDDDGLGYAERMNVHNKRTGDHSDADDEPPMKRRALYGIEYPRVHSAFQPGSTPWRGNRKYLCLNLVGFVWTVDQDIHHTVTVEFYDRELRRDFHFTDPFGYDKACLNDKGTLFSSNPTDDQPAMIYYRPHETWTTRSDWRGSLPPGESATAIALSDSYIVVTTSSNYVRVYTLFGTPVRIYKHKSIPVVTCASWRDYVLTIGNGSVGGDGQTRLLYSIENIKRDEVCQSEDIVPVPEEGELQTVFFSDAGDPCIYDSNGLLLILLHWRSPGQARWVPILDTRRLDRLASGRKEENYWPVAVAQEKFYCIILKGEDRYPYFPRPLLNEFPFQIPLGSSPNIGDEDSSAEAKRLEESYVRIGVLLGLQEDLVSATNSTHQQRAELSQKSLDIDKTLLQLLAVECVEGEEKGMKGLELVSLMRDRSGRMMDAAGKVAARFGRNVLGEKIQELAERRLVGLDGDEAQN